MMKTPKYIALLSITLVVSDMVIGASPTAGSDAEAYRKNYMLQYVNDLVKYILTIVHLLGEVGQLEEHQPHLVAEQHLAPQVHHADIRAEVGGDVSQLEIQECYQVDGLHVAVVPRQAGLTLTGDGTCHIVRKRIDELAHT